MIWTHLNMYNISDDASWQWDNCWNNYQWALRTGADENLLPFETETVAKNTTAVDTFKLRKISIKGNLKTVETETYITLDKTLVVRKDGDSVSSWSYAAGAEIAGLTDGDLVEYYLKIDANTIFISDPICINQTQAIGGDFDKRDFDSRDFF